MIASTQITNTEIITFMSVLVFKLWSHKVLFLNGKDDKLLKGRLLSKKIVSFFGKLLQKIRNTMWNFQDTFETRKQSFISAFSMVHGVTFKLNSVKFAWC